ncbi:hypothetical protein EYC84_009075 [Monilinia fructicola]|uniref:Uncharacterized protein n=1 Tax=Monilinia fructicola TaxID=38448 RepID=A0A5M9JF22_MONFR|nr:hypothetical protein EYC84_009075 [Monilinia fructicola]
MEQTNLFSLFSFHPIAKPQAARRKPHIRINKPSLSLLFFPSLVPSSSRSGPSWRPARPARPARSLQILNPSVLDFAFPPFLNYHLASSTYR